MVSNFEWLDWQVFEHWSLFEFGVCKTRFTVIVIFCCVMAILMLTKAFILIRPWHNICTISNLLLFKCVLLLYTHLISIYQIFKKRKTFGIYFQYQYAKGYAAITKFLSFILWVIFFKPKHRLKTVLVAMTKTIYQIWRE